MKSEHSRALAFALVVSVGGTLLGCQPTVKVEPPKEPIVVNLNVKIEHEVRIKVEKEVETLFNENPDLF
jgi:hypothetical protein